MRRKTLGLLPVLVLGACGAADGAGGSPAAEAAAAVSEVPAANGPGTRASVEAGQHGSRAVSESSDLLEFEFAYPAAAGAIPPLKARLDERLATERADMAEGARQAKEEAEANGYPFHPYGSWTSWEVVTDLPRWLSLSQSYSAYTGGAHPNHRTASLLWDREEGAEREVLSLFASAAALEAAVQPQLCQALDRQREEKRGEPVVRAASDWMTECPALDSVTVLLGSATKEKFDRLGFLFDPYVAGPYAEGGYEVTLPVTQAVIAAVRPEFRASFASGR